MPVFKFSLNPAPNGARFVRADSIAAARVRAFKIFGAQIRHAKVICLGQRMPWAPGAQAGYDAACAEQWQRVDTAAILRAMAKGGRVDWSRREAEVARDRAMAKLDRLAAKAAAV